MDDGLKQRLVGAVVLVGAAVIFLPSVLDGPDLPTTAVEVEVPPRPKFEVIAPIVKDTDKQEEAMRQRLAQERAEYSAEPEADEADKDDPSKDSIDGAGAKTVAQTTPDQQSSTKSKPSSTAKPADQPKQVANKSDTEPKLSTPLAKAWTIQLASFTKKSNADELERKLVADKYRAYSEPVSTDKGTVYRVFVGPDLKKDRAEKTLQQLQNKVGLSGMIVRYEP